MIRDFIIRGLLKDPKHGVAIMNRKTPQNIMITTKTKTNISNIKVSPFLNEYKWNG